MKVTILVLFIILGIFGWIWKLHSVMSENPTFHVQKMEE